MSKLLVSSHTLLIETGRWHRPHSIPREDRTCNICNKLEDVTNWKMNTISLSNVLYILIYEENIFQDITGAIQTCINYNNYFVVKSET